ncbi:MAG: hypothetical protein AAF570_14620, partial [Bacteroidota bacterium]
CGDCSESCTGKKEVNEAGLVKEASMNNVDGKKTCKYSKEAAMAQKDGKKSCAWSTAMAKKDGKKCGSYGMNAMYTNAADKDMKKSCNPAMCAKMKAMMAKKDQSDQQQPSSDLVAAAE